MKTRQKTSNLKKIIFLNLFANFFKKFLRNYSRNFMNLKSNKNFKEIL